MTGVLATWLRCLARTRETADRIPVSADLHIKVVARNTLQTSQVDDVLLNPCSGPIQTRVQCGAVCAIAAPLSDETNLYRQFLTKVFFIVIFIKWCEMYKQVFKYA